MIAIRHISTDDPLFNQACRLRDEALLGPLGLDLETFRTHEPGAEERAEHYVAILDHPHGPRVVACAMLVPHEPDPSSGRVMQVVVDPQRQGEGIGRRLLATIESRAFGDLALTQLICDANFDAVGFYESLGWILDGNEYTRAGIPHKGMVVRAPRPASGSGPRPIP